MNAGGAALPATEAVAATHDLDTLGTTGVVALLAREQSAAAEAVARATPAIVVAVDAIVARLRGGGALHYVGAGTSGRLAMLDAAECPPTFGTPPSLVVAHVAGGEAALVRAVEGAEDDAAAGAFEMRSIVARDAVVGISASGGAPGARGGRAHDRGRKRCARRARAGSRTRDRFGNGCRTDRGVYASQSRDGAEARVERVIDGDDDRARQGLR
jgi:N-acetylmuramic acid 6-phosphate etherase